MRLTACALSAVLLSGCSWFGGNQYDAWDHSYTDYGYYGGDAAGCAPIYPVQQTQSVTSCGSSYSTSGSTVGHYGQSGSLSTALRPINGQYGATSGKLMSSSAAGGAYLAGGTTSASYVPGGVVTRHAMATGQVHEGAGYGPAMWRTTGTSYHGGYGYNGYNTYAGGFGGSVGGGTMPWGVEVAVGTELNSSGDIFPGEPTSKALVGRPGSTSPLRSVSYDDAFENAQTYSVALSYDMDRNTTVFGQVGFLKADGKRVQVGTVENGAGLTEDYFSEFDTLEQTRLEAGVRRYLGTAGLRPYVGATAGMVKTGDVTLTQSSATIIDPAVHRQTFIQDGWQPTASGIVGAEWAVGNRVALGVETGVRWEDAPDAIVNNDARISIPLKLRGRVAF